MAETTELEQEAQAAAEPAAEPAPAQMPGPQPAVGPQPAAEELKQAKKESEGGGALLAILTILLLLVGIGELLLCAFIGVTLYRQEQARNRLEAEQTSLQTGTQSQTALTASQYGYLSPWLRMKNGEVTWRREDGAEARTLVDPSNGAAPTSRSTFMEVASPPPDWIQLAQPEA